MAKKIRFPLVMADGAEVRSLDELREHFDLESVLGYYNSGKLLTWLNDRYYREEAGTVQALDETAGDFQKRLCEALGVEYVGASVDMEEIALRQERLAKLRVYTDEQEFIEHIDQVAFDQEDLADLLDEGISTIYLCGKSFSIPLSVKNMCYIGINDPEITVSSKKAVDFGELNITFEGTHFSQKYEEVKKTNLTTTPEQSSGYHGSVVLREHRINSNMLVKYEVDADGVRYTNTQAIFLCKDGEDDRLLFAPSADLVNNGFVIKEAEICKNIVYFTATIETECPALPGDPPEAVLTGDCLFRYSLENSHLSLIRNRLIAPSKAQIFASANGCVALAEVPTKENRKSLFGLSIAEQFGLRKFQFYLFIPKNYPREHDRLELLTENSCFLAQNYFLSKEYDDQHSIQIGSILLLSCGGLFLGKASECFYFLIYKENDRESAAVMTDYYQMQIIEVPMGNCGSIQTDTIRTCSYDKNRRIGKWTLKNHFWVSAGLLLYVVYDENVNKIKIMRRKNLCESPECLLEDVPSNFNFDYCKENPVFSVRDHAVYCCYNKDTPQTYLCDLP